MLGSVFLRPVGASPLRPDRVLHTNRAGVLRDRGLYNGPIVGRVVYVAERFNDAAFALSRS